MTRLIIYCLLGFFACIPQAFAGNPERIGQAGGTQLLVNPYARSSGSNGANAAFTMGIESAITNPAGIAHTRKSEVVFAHTRWMNTADISVNALGISQALGERGGVLGLSIVSFGFGDIPITTIDNPDGGLGTYSPTFLNLGLSYAQTMVSDRIFIGATLKLIHESIPDVSATGIAFDGGVQYQSKGKEGRPGNFRLGVALRNVGPQMQYRGDGLSYRAATGGPGSTFDSRVSTVASSFELPSVLNVSAAYHIRVNFNDTTLTAEHMVTPMFAFVSNSFGNDQYILGAEYAFRNMLMLRASYSIEDEGGDREATLNAFTGLALGATFEVPFVRRNALTSHGNSTFGVDYSMRQTYFFGFTHSIGIRLNI